jgi:hypothetical protein
MSTGTLFSLSADSRRQILKIALVLDAENLALERISDSAYC